MPEDRDISQQLEDKDDEHENWETTSIDPDFVSLTDSSTAIVEREEGSSPESDTPPPIHSSPLDAYWVQRAKFITHLEKRANKFDKKSKQDYVRARWGKPKPAKYKPVIIPRRPPPLNRATPAPQGINPQAETPANQVSADTSLSNPPNMIASTSKGLVRAAGSATNLIRPTIRPFSSTTPQLKAKGKKETAIDLNEATRILRALEIASPYATYNITVNLIPKNKKKNAPRPTSMRGRVVLPSDPRRFTDQVLVFAERNSPSAKLAIAEGVTWVGAEELFVPILNGEIEPTKVLCTPGMLPAVTARLARFLGPKNLMPTARRGGLGEGAELVERIREAKGAVDWKSHEGIVRATIARMNFTAAQVDGNVRALLADIRASVSANSGTTSSLDDALVSRRNKSKTGQGIYGVHLSSTNGPNILIDDVD